MIDVERAVAHGQQQVRVGEDVGPPASVGRLGQRLHRGEERLPKAPVRNCRRAASRRGPRLARAAHAAVSPPLSVLPDCDVGPEQRGEALGHEGMDRYELARRDRCRESLQVRDAGVTRSVSVGERDAACSETVVERLPARLVEVTGPLRPDRPCARQTSGTVEVEQQGVPEQQRRARGHGRELLGVDAVGSVPFDQVEAARTLNPHTLVLGHEDTDARPVRLRDA